MSPAYTDVGVKKENLPIIPEKISTREITASKLKCFKVLVHSFDCTEDKIVYQLFIQSHYSGNLIVIQILKKLQVDGLPLLSG
jgi:hypothetical protein